MKFSKGQSLFEVVVALAISTLVIIAVVALASNSIRNTTFSKDKTLAANYAQEATEWLRNQRDTNIDLFITSSGTTQWCISSLSFSIQGKCPVGNTISGTNFYREVSFPPQPPRPDGKIVIEADVKVYWTDSQGDHEVVSATNYTDWRQR